MSKALDGIDHIGDLFRRIRGAHDFERTDLKDRGLGPSEFSKFEDKEKTKTPEERYISRNAIVNYIHGLKLPPDQHDLLLNNFVEGSEGIQFIDNQQVLCNIRFSKIRDEDDPDCVRLLYELHKQKFPAFIMDPLWFTHVLNRHLLDLFGLTEEDLKTNNEWWQWHSVGAKYHPKSKIRQCLADDTQSYGPNVVRRFFETTAPYFFTAHMQWLRNQLWPLSSNFRRRWEQLITFQSDDPLDEPMMRVREPRKGKPLVIDVKEEEACLVKMGEDLHVRYALVVMTPRDEGLWEDYKASFTSPLKDQVYFADDFIDDYNRSDDWPEIREGCKENFAKLEERRKAEEERQIEKEAKRRMKRKQS